MKRATLLIALLAIGVLSMAIVASQAPGGQRGPNVAQIEKVRDNLYMITGGGGNTAAFITDRGVVVVDTKLARETKGSTVLQICLYSELVAAAQKLTPEFATW